MGVSELLKEKFHIVCQIGDYKGEKKVRGGRKLPWKKKKGRERDGFGDIGQQIK